MEYSFAPIGRIRTPYPEKFAIPRQPSLVSAANCHIELYKQFDREEILRGLDEFSHIWVVFVFHQSIRDNWKPTVRPPRLGGNQRVGVFASRSPFRPNPIGLSVLELTDVQQVEGHWQLQVRGADVVDGTPILDIKPYLGYADAIADATCGYAPDAPAVHSDIDFSAAAHEQLRTLETCYPDIRKLIIQVLAQSPEPAYKRPAGKNYGMQLYDINIRWQSRGDKRFVTSLERLY